MLHICGDQAAVVAAVAIELLVASAGFVTFEGEITEVQKWGRV